MLDKSTTKTPSKNLIPAKIPKTIAATEREISSINNLLFCFIEVRRLLKKLFIQYHIFKT